MPSSGRNFARTRDRRSFHAGQMLRAAPEVGPETRIASRRAGQEASAWLQSNDPARNPDSDTAFSKSSSASRPRRWKAPAALRSRAPRCVDRIRSDPRPPITAASPAFTDSASRTSVARNAGSKPNKITVAMPHATANATTLPSNGRSSSPASRYGLNRRIGPRSSQAMPTPAPHATKLSSVLSVINCAIKRAREPPSTRSDRKFPIALRQSRRARRLLTLAQAIHNRNPAAASSTRLAVFAFP